MMEEAGDDTNGESTFEFVGEKDASLSNTPSEPDDKQGKGGNSSQEANTTVPETSQSFLTMAYCDSNQEFLAADPKPDSTTPENPTMTSILPPPQPLPSFATPPNPNSNIPLETSAVTSSVPLPPPPTGDSFIGHRTLPLSYPYTYGRPNVQPLSPALETQPLPPPPTHIMTPSAAVELPIAEDPGFSVLSQSKPLLEQTTESNGGGGGVWGFLNKVAEKAKNSVDSVITTLDPGMKEFIYSGGDIDIIVASDKEAKVSPIREAFQQVFGRATIEGMNAQAPSIAAQPVGYISGLKGAEERINFLRQQGMVHVQQPIIALENFIADVTPEMWFDIGCLILQDPVLGVNLHVYTQATPVPVQYITQMQQQTSSDYPQRWSGLAVTVGQVVGHALGVPHNQWHEALTGVTRREMIFLAARSLAGIYKRHLGR